ncbi:MAG: CoA transferase, partial [Candidatus Cloacimonadaceae bacterium]|nr:CoA transferase [Candidatus Cloacimonadaceae bacterium]
LMKDPQVLSRNMIVSVEDDEAGTIKIAGNPIKMDTIPECETRNRVPDIGEHNREIYGDLLGISEDEMIVLRSEGVI